MRRSLAGSFPMATRQTEIRRPDGWPSQTQKRRITLTESSIMECCNQKMRDWSFHEQSILENKVSHHYCQKCGSHIYRDKTYTADEWFFYINGISFKEYRRQEKEGSSDKQDMQQV
jgi:predicted RNA-binding Zn-ribbon protein involved in translation (DUF1610 family)